MTEIKWGKRQRARKADQGHSPVQYGYSERDPWHRRSYVRCQCGKRYSGQGDTGGMYSFHKHVKRELEKGN